MLLKACWALLDGLLLAAASAGIVALRRGDALGWVLPAGLLAAYAGLLLKRRGTWGVLAAALIGGVALGAFELATRERAARPAPPEPALVGLMRAHLSEYRAGHQGAYPSRLEDLVPRYAPAVPVVGLDGHEPSAAVEPFGPEICAPGGPDPLKVRDTGRWGYVGDPKAPCWGGVFLDCVHQDPSGRPYHTY